MFKIRNQGPKYTLLVILAAVGAGCGGETDGGPDEASFHTQYLTGHCERLMECNIAGIGSLSNGDVDVCLQLMTDMGLAPYNQAALDQALATGSTVFSPSNAQDCVDSLVDAPCDAIYGHGLASTVCAAVYLGQQPDGADCSSDAECAGGYCMLSSECAGQCYTRMANGQPCNSAIPCVHGSYCNRLLDVCEASLPLQAGEPCGTTTAPCGLGLVCDEASHSCVSLGGAGTPCAGTEDCQDGFICRELDYTCSAVTAEQQAGEPCGNEDTGFYCDPSLGLGCAMEDDGSTLSWTICVALGQQGDECYLEDATAGTETSLPCDAAAGLYCAHEPTGSSCAPKKYNGSSCTNNAQCLSGLCDGWNEICVADGVDCW